MGVIEQMQKQLEDLNKGMAILLERSGLASSTSKSSDKTNSEKAIEAAVAGRGRGRAAPAEDKSSDEPAGRGRGRAAAPTKAKKMTAGDFEAAVEAAFQVENIQGLKDLNLTEADFDAVYEDFGTGLKPILEHLGVNNVKDVKKDEDRLFVLKYFELATELAIDDKPMPTVEDVEDATNATGDASGDTEEKPTRRGRR